MVAYKKAFVNRNIPEFAFLAKKACEVFHKMPNGKFEALC